MNGLVPVKYIEQIVGWTEFDESNNTLINFKITNNSLFNEIKEKFGQTLNISLRAMGKIIDNGKVEKGPIFEVNIVPIPTEDDIKETELIIEKLFNKI